MGGAKHVEMMIPTEGGAGELVHHRRRHPELAPDCRFFQLVPSSYKRRDHVDCGFHSREHRQKTKMEGLKLSFIFLVLFGFVCLGYADTFPNLIPKSSNDNTNAGDKAAVSSASGDKSPAEAAATATTTSEPGSACGGLKGFLHICDKKESADPPKNVQKRSPSDDDSDDSSDSSDDSSDDSDEKPAEKSSATTEKGVVKRQAEDPEAPDAPEEPPMVDSALPQPEDAAADLMALNKRQTDDSSSSEETEEDKRR